MADLPHSARLWVVRRSISGAPPSMFHRSASQPCATRSQRTSRHAQSVSAFPLIARAPSSPGGCSGRSSRAIWIGSRATFAFQYSPSGKPSLRDVTESGDLHFNVSHADGVALYAITRGRAIGVDIERVRADMANERIAARFFSPREVATLRSLRPDLQSEAFFTCWTRKEAYVKARGVGITAGLDQFDVSLAPDEPAAILANRDASEAHRPWSLYHLAPCPGYVGAVAAEGERHLLSYWQWQEPCGCARMTP